MNFSVFTKQICRFLIQRYMGQYLKTELSSDQLELHLADGTASVQGVTLNTEYINETLEASGVRILSLKDGYVEELTVCVPWKRLLLDSTIVKINGLQLTLTPLQEINMANTQELMSSFVGSIASSMELAKSVIVDEQLANGADNTGIEQCASLIDQIIARIKVQFENVTVRLESYSADLCTGVEVQIDRMEFLDEQLEEQQRNASSNAITEQPGGLYTVTDLNKLLHVQNVRLYTDIWSPIRDNRMCASRTSDATESDGGGGGGADMAASSMNFQSCYSHFSSRSNSNNFSQQKSQDIIPPNPTLIAQLFDDKHTLRIRVRNNSALSYAENSFYNKRIDVDLFFRAPLYLLLTPSQLVLLQKLFTLLAPRADEKVPPDTFGTTSENGGCATEFYTTTAAGGSGGAVYSQQNATGGGVPMGPQQYAKLIEQMQKGAVYGGGERLQQHHQPPSSVNHHYIHHHHQPTASSTITAPPTFGLGGPGSWSGGTEQRFYDLSELGELGGGGGGHGHHHNHQQQRKGHCPLVEGVEMTASSNASSAGVSTVHQQAAARYRSNSLDSQQGMGAHSNRQSSTSIATLVERRPDIFAVSVRAPALVAVITHDDPLSADAILQQQQINGDEERLSFSSSSSSVLSPHPPHPSPLLVASVVQQMNERAQKFFAAAKCIKIGKQRRLEEQREQFGELYDGDCLRFVANDFFTSFTFTTDLQRVLFESKGHLKECDFIECLQSAQNGMPPQCIDILNIAAPDERRTVLKNDILTFQINNSFEKQNDYKLTIGMEQCRMDVDFSLMDRLSPLLCVQPFFTTKNAVQNKLSPPPALFLSSSESVFVGGLKDDFEMGGGGGCCGQGGEQPMPKTFHAKCYFNKLLLNLRIPIANPSSSSSVSSPSDGTFDYRKRCLHPEYLHLALDSVNLELPKFSLADLCLFWTLSLECKTAKGTFVGDPSVLQCPREAMTFFFADTSNAEKTFGNKGMKLELRYDARDKVLSKCIIHQSANNKNSGAMSNCGDGGDYDGEDDAESLRSAKNMYESFYRPSEADRVEGPFSKKNAYFTYNCASNSAFDQKIIVAGGRHEMLEFAKECQQQTNFAIELFITQLNIAFPCHKFFELLYNRFAFDLALWRPKSPHFAKKMATNAMGQHQQQNNGKTRQQFTECFSSFLPFNGTTANNNNNNNNNNTNHFDDPSSFFGADPSSAYHHRSASHDNANAKNAVGGADSHLLTVALHVAKTQLLLQTTVDGATAAAAAPNNEDNAQTEMADDDSRPFNAQLVANLAQTECFLVYGFGEDPDLAYFFLTSSKAELYHNNLLGRAKPICADVTDSQQFATPTPKQRGESVCCCFEDGSATEQHFERVEDNNLAIALKMHYQPEPKHTKNILVAFGLRNSLIHLRPFASTRFFWVSQFANFFTVPDYDGVPGYVLPKVEANMHVHLQSVFVGYDHCLTTPSSPFQLRVEIGLAYLTSNIVKDIARLKFDCHLHDLIMWMRKRPVKSIGNCSSSASSDHGTTTETSSVSSSSSIFTSSSHNQCPPAVKVFHCEAIHFIVAFTIAVGEVPGPLFDFECANNSVTVWLCADTVIEFVNILAELYRSDTVQQLLSNDAQTEMAQQERLYKLIECSSKRNAAANANKRSTENGGAGGASSNSNISLEEEQRLIKMMEAAMSDLSATIPKSATNTRKSAGGGGGGGGGGAAKSAAPPQRVGGGRRAHQNGTTSKNLFEIDEAINDFDGGSSSSFAGGCSPQNSSTTTENTDDEYILIDTPPKRNGAAAGVTQIGDRFQTRIDMGGDFEFVTVPIGGAAGCSSSGGGGNNGTISKAVDDLTTNLCPLFRFEVALSLDIFLFGGTDFGESARTMARKTYSKWSCNNLDRRMSDEIGSQGGKYRDHTVVVQVHVSKLSFVSKVFDKSSPILSYNKLRVGEFKVFDHLSISHINEMIHRLEGPRSVTTPFFSGYLIEDPLREAILRLSLAPIRMNIDQDTIEFLMDFKTDVMQSLRATFDFPVTRSPKNGAGIGSGCGIGTISDDIPLMEVAKGRGPGMANNANNATTTNKMPPKTARAPGEKNSGNKKKGTKNLSGKSSPDGLYPTKLAAANNNKSSPDRGDLCVSFKVLKTRDELLVDEEHEEEDGEEDTNTLDRLFSEDDVHFSDSFCAKLNLADANEQKQDDDEEEEDEESDTSDSTAKVGPSTGGLAAKDTFIKDFSFSPACLLRIDYEAKRVKTDQQGALIGFLIGMANLNKTELTLKEMRIERGFLGIEKCAQFVINEWVKDIMNKQFPNVVGSLAPINALVQLAQGFHDLFALPYDELRKENGQLFRGIQRGTTSFGLNAATAAIDATQRVVGLVQNVAELAFDIVNPNFQRHRRLLSGPQRVQVAGDLREGFSLAYNAVREGVLDTAQTLQAAAAEDRALGGLGMGVLRHMTPSAIKPFVIASKATSLVLGGLKNQLKPEDYREEMRKWRQLNNGSGGGAVVAASGAVAIGGTAAAIRRQGSSGTMPSSSSLSSASSSSSSA
ncbi:hypothetical protein niasHT_031078 [Heterodera trifolii]|uniref:Autophagy-related protein 2 n=1 Tax=Heterodera trifolii TaxID=157864 RepID=A0ABD2HVI5_9BILA